MNAERRKAENPANETQRLDWYARVTKTRTLASTLVQGGKVRVNRQKTEKPGLAVKIDDVITIAVHGRVRVLKVIAPGRRRGPAAEAAELFEDLSLPAEVANGDGIAAGAKVVRGGERPTKKARRTLDRLRGREGE